MDKPRFTLTLTIRDNHGFEQPISMAIGCDKALRISTRAVGDMKLGAALGVSLVGFNEVVELIRTKEMRRSTFREIALQLAGQLADRMEDAEGWHDESRVDAARKELGGTWK